MISELHPVGPEEVMAYLDGELAAERALEVAKHVEACGECRGLVRDLQAVSRRMGEWEVGSCGAVAPEGKAKVRKWWRRWPVLAVAGVGVVLVILVRPVKQHSDYRFGRFSRVDAEVPVPVPMPTDQFRAALKTRIAQNSVPQQPSRPVTPTLRSEGFEEQTGDIKLMIARTAQLTLISTDFVHAREKLEAILKSHHGYIGQLTMNAPAGAGRSLDAALRVPSAELDVSMTELKKLGRVESESQSGEEVTQQYVDLEARLANARNAEQRLTAVLQQRTGKMQDVLDVEKEITRVRGEIETMEAERKTLSKRVEFATINVKITEEYKAQLQAPDSIGTRLGNAAVAGYRHVADSAMGLAEFGLEYGLSLAIWVAVLFWPARWAWRHYRAG